MGTLNNLIFVFDRMPDQDGCTFIEVESESGESVNAGEWRLRDDGLSELVVPVNYAAQSELAALREELSKLKQVANFSDAVACVFDMLKYAAANTGNREWDDQLEDLAQDVIEFAPGYKKQWQDICKLQQRLADAERRNAELADLLHATSSPVVDGELFTMERFQARANARTYLAALKPTEPGVSELICNCPKIGETFNPGKHCGACPVHHVSRTRSGASE